MKDGTAPFDLSQSIRISYHDDEPSCKLELLSIDDLHPDPDQPRKFEDGEKSITMLKENIITSGIVFTPIQYRVGEDGLKYIVTGERRWKAAKAAGLTHIPAMEYSGAVDYRIAVYMDNQDRKKLFAMEEALYLQSLLGELNITAQELAKEVNLSKSRMSEMLKSLN